MTIPFNFYYSKEIFICIPLKLLQDINFKQSKLLSEEKSLIKMYFLQWNNI